MEDSIGFVAGNRDIAMKYYDLCDIERMSKKAINHIKKELKKLIKEDPYFLDSYSDYYNILMDEEDTLRARRVINQAYKKAMELILDENKQWPDKMEWGWMANRPIIRAILNKAIDEWNAYNDDVALEIFRKLLRTNPRDNIGVRFYILAILEGMSFEAYERKFNKGGFYDTSSWEWFNKHSHKFSEEFPSIEEE